MPRAHATSEEITARETAQEYRDTETRSPRKDNGGNFKIFGVSIPHWIFTDTRVYITLIAILFLVWSERASIRQYFVPRQEVLSDSASVDINHLAETVADLSTAQSALSQSVRDDREELGKLQDTDQRGFDALNRRFDAVLLAGNRRK